MADESTSKALAAQLVKKSFGNEQASDIESDEEKEGVADEGLNAAAEDTMNAFHAKDVDKLAKSLKNFYDMCKE